MSKREKKTKEKFGKARVVSLIFFIIAMLCNAFLIYNVLKLSGIEDMIRYTIIGVLGVIDLVLLIKMIMVWKNKKKKKSKRIGFIILLVIYALINGCLGGVIAYLYGTLDSMNKRYVNYSSSLVVLTDNSAESVDDITEYTIGMLKDKKNPEGFIIPNEIVKENKLADDNDIKYYDSYSEMIVDLYAGELDSAFLASNYVTTFSAVGAYEKIGDDTKVIIKKSKKMLKVNSNDNASSSGKAISEPFTMLLMGIDSTNESIENAVANGDSLILVTFNPKTLNVTMLSIPRDSFVPLTCLNNKENKITHAAAYGGTECMMSTIENYFDVNIDYYAKINFKGVVHLVDALGGIDVEVPADLCTDDSNRTNEVCISKGWQHLNGEQALVLSRNRKQLSNGDFGRGLNQQVVLEAMVNKVKDLSSVSTFMDIINTISINLDTNLSTKQMLSFYNVAKDIIKLSLTNKDAQLVNIQQLFLYGHGAMIYDSRMGMTLYDYVPNTYSKKDIIKAMKENLELVDHEEITSFSFSINSPYEKTVIGQGPYKSTYNASDYASAPKSSSSSSDEKDTSNNSTTVPQKKVIYGCTDSTATNYNSSATDDDGSCIKKPPVTEEPPAVIPPPPESSNPNPPETGNVTTPQVQ